MTCFDPIAVTEEAREHARCMEMYCKLFFQGRGAKRYDPTPENIMQLAAIYQKVFCMDIVFSAYAWPEKNKIIFGVSNHKEAVELLQMEHIKLFELFRAFFPILNLNLTIQVNP